MLRVWFICQPVPGQQGVKTKDSIDFCAKGNENATVRLLVSEGIKGAKTHR
jgi:hypothetical protein